MSNSERLRALLSKGYFPKELPPAFTTEDFGSHIADILSDWEAAKLYKIVQAAKLPGKKRKRGSFTYDVPNAEIEAISVPKRGYERRNVHVTHPLPQALLSQEIASNWRAIQAWLSRQRYSMDEIRVSSKYARSIKGINFELHRAKKAYIEATADWLVKTDITRFYPSIYTHSIPWAAYGKERVKSNLKLYQGSLADRLDVLVRSCNRNQTIGIPIGPETSRILAEILSSRVDSEAAPLLEDLPVDAIDRLQDDWFVGVKTLERAETSLSSIMAVYRSYGLEINGSKTSVTRVIGHAEESWISELGAFLSHRPGPIRGNRLREFLILSLRLQSLNLKDPVVSYSLSVLENQATVPADVEVVESFLLKASIVAPASMGRICQMLLNLEHDTRGVSRQRVGPRFTELVERNLLNGNTYEAIWMLYTLRGLKIYFKSATVCELAAATTSSALALVLLDLENRGLCVHKLPKSNWENAITKERVRCDWIWLLGYEGFRHGWLADTKGIMADPFFAAMASRNVAFYDPRRNVLRTAKTVKMRAGQRKRNLRAVARFLLTTRGFTIEDY